MRKLEAKDLRSIGLFKHYRIIRKWACKTYELKDADLELLIYFDCLDLFTRQDYLNGSYTYSWDKNRWERLRREGWIQVWRHRKGSTQKYTIYKTSFKCSQLISRIYRILLGIEDLPTSLRRNKIMEGNSYTDKVMIKAINLINKDKDR
jgi:hypothetical protein|tara:strand:+ start:3282 stop:3728 length:447 start_codon:yes stop_codon:yes gene_type:complete